MPPQRALVKVWSGSTTVDEPDAGQGVDGAGISSVPLVKIEATETLLGPVTTMSLPNPLNVNHPILAQASHN
jgi:hypothetical protein